MKGNVDQQHILIKILAILVLNMKLTYVMFTNLLSRMANVKQILKMCDAFASNGLDVTLIVPFFPEKKVQELRHIYNLKNNFKIKKVFCFRDKAPFPLNKINGFLFVFQAYILVNLQRPDIIFSRDLGFSSFYLKLRSLNLVLKRAFFIFEVHALYFLTPSGEKEKSIVKKEEMIFKHADMLVAITAQLKKRIMHLNIAKEKIIVEHDGVDLSFFNELNSKKADLRKELKIPEDKKIIVYTGSNFADWKGIHILIDAFKLLEMNDVLLYIVGGTEEHILKLKRKVNPKYANKIIFTGFFDEKTVVKYLCAADVLVLPNVKGIINEVFTSPLKLFEYMAAKKPIVASDLPTIREILDEKSAILVEPGTSTELKKGIIKALSDKRFAEKISLEAYSRVKKHTWENRARRILASYQKLVTGNNY